MSKDDVLLSWLCIARFNVDGVGNTGFLFPESVAASLRMRGWMQCEDSDDDEALMSFTAEGKAMTDMWAPEYGIELVFE